MLYALCVTVTKKQEENEDDNDEERLGWRYFTHKKKRNTVANLGMQLHRDAYLVIRCEEKSGCKVLAKPLGMITSILLVLFIQCIMHK